MSNIVTNEFRFIHIPKCGGTFIQSALWNIGAVKQKSECYYDRPHYGHLFLSQMEEEPEKFTFAFVRNPVTWWESFYTWNKKDGDSRFTSVEKQTADVNEWMRDYGQFWLGLYAKIVKRYLGEDPLFPTTNKIDYIGKMENLEQDFATALRLGNITHNKTCLDTILNKTIEMPPSHRNCQDYNHILSDENKQLILQAEKEIVDRFYTS